MKNLDIYVIRVDRNSQLKESKPCSDCLKYLKRAKLFRYCFYSNINGQMVRTRLKDLTNTHKTTGHRDILRKQNIKILNI